MEIIIAKNTFIFLKIVLIILISIVINLLIKLFFKTISKKIMQNKIDEEKRSNNTRLHFVKRIITTLVYLLPITYILLLIPGVRNFSYSIVAGAGIIALIIGFAAQKTIANLIAGISIAIYTPFRLGDRIKFKEEFGEVESITLRHTVIKTWDNRRYIIPNSLMSENEITNYSIKDEKIKWTVNMGISYDSSIDKARKIMLKAAKQHPKIIIPEIKDEEGKIQKNFPEVMVTECGDFAVNLRMYFWIKTHADAWKTSFELIETIKKEFDKKGIEIPYPHTTIVYKKDKK